MKLSTFFTCDRAQVFAQITDKNTVRKPFFWKRICALLLFTLTAPSLIEEGHLGGDLASVRAPASVVSDCLDDMQSFLGKRPRLVKAWSKFKRLKSGYKLDIKKLDFLREEYSLAHSSGSLGLKDIERSSEGILAYIEAINKNIGGQYVPEPKSMNFFRRRKIANIVELMNSNGKLLLNDIEELSSDLYLARYGPSMKLNEVLFEDHIEKRVLARVIQEDLAAKGLSHVFTKYKILSKRKTWAQKFVRSKIGRSLGTGIMNLPVLFGMPPLYLPNLRPIKIPDFLLEELLEKGLTNEMMTKLEQEISRELGDKLTFSLQNRARYRIFKKYYMAGISSYLTYMLITEFYETNNSLKKEGEALGESASEVTSTIEDAMDLESRGYSIFKEVDKKSPDSENRWCQNIDQCIASEEADLGEKIIKGSETYLACREYMDPHNLCSRY